MVAQEYSKLTALTRSHKSPCWLPDDPKGDNHHWFTVPMPFAHNVSLLITGIGELRIRLVERAVPSGGVGHLHAKVMYTYRPSMMQLVPLVEIPRGRGTFLGVWLMLDHAYLMVQEGDQFMTWNRAQSAQVHTWSLFLGDTAPTYREGGGD